ncbi:response regulator transcription factor [Dyella soli]|uniref:Response regulator transcription factor n=2 Tax=Dyella soli TaxID=522319 RepID=A0A4R0YGP8_9GAMM|nr:response regulator transcription factor [Dyella soli]
MRVIIADDHPVVLLGLKALLAGHGARVEIVGEATNGTEVLALVGSVACDLVITDFFSMADSPAMEDGLTMLRHLHERHPEVAVLVLTMLDNLALVQGMLARGVRGVVDKAAMTRELNLAMTAIRAGRIYLSERIRQQMHEQSLAASDGRSLSTREVEVVRLIARGHTVSEIAKQTHRSLTTISQQKRDAMRKLGLENDKQLHEYARANGLLN